MLDQKSHPGLLEEYLQSLHPGKLNLYSLPPTFVPNRKGVDVETPYGAVTVVWKHDSGSLRGSTFSMCVVEGCNERFKREYRSKFPERYTELNVASDFGDAIEKVRLIRA